MGYISRVAVLVLCSRLCFGAAIAAALTHAQMPNFFSTTRARLYEQCSAASALCVRLTMAAQVYGGSLSLVVGAYLWSRTLFAGLL